MSAVFAPGARNVAADLTGRPRPRRPYTLWLFEEPLAWPRRTVPALARAPRDRWAARLTRGCDNLGYPCRLLLLPRVPARRRAAPRAPQASGGNAPAWLLAQQGGTGTARQDAAGPVPAQVPAWAEARRAAPKGIRWPFRTADARGCLKHLHPYNRSLMKSSACHVSIVG